MDCNVDRLFYTWRFILAVFRKCMFDLLDCSLSVYMRLYVHLRKKSSSFRNVVNVYSVACSIFKTMENVLLLASDVTSHSALWLYVTNSSVLLHIRDYITDCILGSVRLFNIFVKLILVPGYT